MFDQPENTDTTNVVKGNFKRADAYINFYLPAVKRDGENGRQKLGSIKLYLAKKNEKPLIEWLQADPTRVIKLLATAEIDFQMDEAPAGTGFILEDETVEETTEDTAEDTDTAEELETTEELVPDFGSESHG